MEIDGDIVGRNWEGKREWSKIYKMIKGEWNTRDNKSYDDRGRSWVFFLWVISFCFASANLLLQSDLSQYGRDAVLPTLYLYWRRFVYYSIFLAIRPVYKTSIFLAIRIRLMMRFVYSLPSNCAPSWRFERRDKDREHTVASVIKIKKKKSNHGFKPTAWCIGILGMMHAAFGLVLYPTRPITRAYYYLNLAMSQDSWLLRA